MFSEGEELEHKRWAQTVAVRLQAHSVELGHALTNGDGNSSSTALVAAGGVGDLEAAKMTPKAAKSAAKANKSQSDMLRFFSAKKLKTT